MSAPHTSQPLGVVVIGRNEGERLGRCLRSLEGFAGPVVYVDSASSDASVQLARSMNITTIELSTDRAMSAARARNEGFTRLVHDQPALLFVQFVDGDCEVEPTWLDAAIAAFDGDETLGAVCGRLRERAPDASIYNRLCDMEWNVPPGEARHCGGIFAVRAATFKDAGMFDPTVIAGEEPDLCARLRARESRIVRLAVPMATHDADMHTFSQWWKRAVRGGHAFAITAQRNGRNDRGALRQIASSMLYGVLVPASLLALLIGAFSRAMALVPAGFLLALLALVVVRIARSRRRIGDPPAHALLYALFCLLAKPAQALGIARFTRDLLLRRPPRILEHRVTP